jgi:hypothetical protein
MVPRPDGVNVEASLSLEERVHAEMLLDAVARLKGLADEQQVSRDGHLHHIRHEGGGAVEGLAPRDDKARGGKTGPYAFKQFNELSPFHTGPGFAGVPAG